MNIPLNINLQQILLHLLNFTILAGGLYFLLYGPVKKFMEKREKHYADMKAETESELAKAQALEEQYKARLESADAEISELKAEAGRAARQLSDKIISDAERQKEEIIAEGRVSAEREHRRAVDAAKEEIVGLAVAATEKMMAEGEKK